MIHLNAALLQAPGGGTPITFIILQFTAIALVIYWLLIRPQQKERQQHQAMVNALKKGDEVVTAGGIIGTIVHVESDRVTMRTAENTRLVIERGKIAALMSSGRSAAADTSTSA